jgi:predicted metal-dependent peptidase
MPPKKTIPRKSSRPPAESPRSEKPCRHDAPSSDEIVAAAAAVETAVVTLLRKEPFHAHLLTSIKRVYSMEVPTAAVSASASGVTLWVNPRFFGGELSAPQRVAVLKHEMLHLLFKHPWRETSNMPDAELRNIAADLVVNQFVAPWRLPAGAIELSMFPHAGLEPDQTMEWYYGKLRDFAKSGGAKAAGAIDAATKKFREQGCDSKWHDKGEDGEKAGATGSGEAAGAVIRGLVVKAKAKTSAKDWGNLPAGLARVVDEICAPPKVPWKRLLRLFAGRGARTVLKTSRLRESTRFPGEPGIRIKRLQKVVVAVDTSGSITPELLSDFLAEINGIARAGAEVTLIQCDCEITGVAAYRHSERPVFKGGGGTDFDPVMRWLRENRRECFGGCIYLTDGHAAAPAIDPRCPVLWVLTPDMNVRHGWASVGEK